MKHSESWPAVKFFAVTYVPSSKLLSTGAESHTVDSFMLHSITLMIPVTYCDEPSMLLLSAPPLTHAQCLLPSRFSPTCMMHPLT